MDLDIPSQDVRSTPLHLAAERAEWSALECLVGWGAAVNPVNKHGNTPLHAVTMKRSPEIPESPQLKQVSTSLLIAFHDDATNFSGSVLIIIYPR